MILFLELLFAKFGRRYWYVTDFWEVFVPIPVVIVGKADTGRLLVKGDFCNYDNGIYEIRENMHEVKEPAELYKKIEDARQEAARRNVASLWRCGNGQISPAKRKQRTNSPI